MTKDEIIEMANQAGIVNPQMVINTLEAFAKLVAQHEREIWEKRCERLQNLMDIRETQPNKPCCLAEREACEALHDHEDVQAPVGNSSWGEAYQEGWGQGTAAYRDAIKARGRA
jgi:hypothetical protein